MNSFARLLLVKMIVITCGQKVAGICENVNDVVSCTDVSEVTNVTISAIKNPSSVRTIKISNNNQLYLGKGAFHPLTSLDRIIIDDNNIHKIYPHIFINLAVKQIYLNFDGIDYIYPGAFANLSHLYTLSLRGNQLTKIPINVFHNLPIKALTLSKNEISGIDDNAFEGLPNLTDLRLDHNRLETIVVHTLITFPEKLEILWLHNNSLTLVTSYMLLKLTNLRVLNLGFNSITSIEPNTFQQTPNLQTLVLTHNHLKNLDGKIFPKGGLNSLEKLYLDNNKLMFLSFNFVSRIDNLRKITIMGNPWLCSCLTDLEMMLKENGIMEKCAEDYTNGKRPLCMSDNAENSRCTHTYNEQLREDFENYKKLNPLYKRTIDCLL